MTEKERITIVNTITQVDETSFSDKETPRLNITIVLNVKDEQTLKEFLASLNRKISVINKRDNSDWMF